MRARISSAFTVAPITVELALTSFIMLPKSAESMPFIMDIMSVCCTSSPSAKVSGAASAPFIIADIAVASSDISQ